LPEGSAPSVRLSVIVPTCNRSPSLARCLAALANQTLPATDFEVIVVDDSGSSGDEPLLPEVTGNLDLKVVRHRENSGAAAARNSGARTASAPFLAFVDDDCVPEPEWTIELMALWLESQSVALAGTVCVVEPQPPADRVTQLLSNPVKASDGTIVRTQSANLAVPADGFEAVGGFDESYVGAGYEDYEFCRRWRKSGRRILAAPKAVVLHQRDTTLREFCRQHYRYGRGAALFYGQAAAEPHPPFKSTLRRMLQTIGAGRTVIEQIGYTGLVGLSQMAALAGFAARRISKP
jgi:GT2 family glycosyltransferase